MLTYTNRKKDTFCVQKLKTEKGTYNYRVIRYKPELNQEDLLMDLSPQYELYEQPFDGRVIIRKKFTSVISDEEVAIVTDFLTQLNMEEYFCVEKLEDQLVVYLGSLTKEDAKDMKQEVFNRAQWFHEKIKIVKNIENVFAIQRYSNLLQFSGWITIGHNENLQQLVETFLPHIHDDSLLNFWGETK